MKESEIHNLQLEYFISTFFQELPGQVFTLYAKLSRIKFILLHPSF